MNWGDRNDWTNREYKKLSEQIAGASGILLSTNTLKRVFGKIKLTTERYNPQEETKNALVIFIGYQHWDDFVRQNQAEPGYRTKRRFRCPPRPCRRAYK